jgi:hypothetical protein
MPILLTSVVYSYMSIFGNIALAVWLIVLTLTTAYLVSGAKLQRRTEQLVNTDVRTQSYDETDGMYANANTPNVIYPAHIIGTDQRRVFDPLLEPVRRPALDNIPPPHIAQYFNIHTTPTFDTPSAIGVLAPLGKGTQINDIIQLFGYRDSVNRYKYNYYTMTKNGVKLDVDVNKGIMELNDKDMVRVQGDPFIVTLYANNYYKYNPYVV